MTNISVQLLLEGGPCPHDNCDGEVEITALHGYVEEVAQEWGVEFTKGKELYFWNRDFKDENEMKQGVTCTCSKTDTHTWYIEQYRKSGDWTL